MPGVQPERLENQLVLRATQIANQRRPLFGKHWRRHFQRQRLDVDHIAVLENQRAMQHVVQLPDVAWPAFAEQRLLRGWRKHASAPRPRRMTRQQVTGERQYIRASLAQRR